MPLLDHQQETDSLLQKINASEEQEEEEEEG